MSSPSSRTTLPIATRFVVPGTTHNAIRRPRLLERLEQARFAALILLKAPAGFGKSELSAAWAHQLHQQGQRVAWLAIDETDDEPSSLLLSLARALNRCAPVLGRKAIALIGEVTLMAPRSVASSLIDDLGAVDGETFIVIDDCHQLNGDETLGMLSFLIQHAPRQVHWILTSRSDLALPLTNLLARNQLVEFDATSLRFDLDETLRFMREEHGDRFGPDDIKLLHTATEGWPAALRIACTSLRDEGSPASWLRGLSGAYRRIDAYMAGILARLPVSLTDFMLRTCVLERLGAELCDALVGDAGSREALDTLAERRLLLIPLDPHGAWYRYHHLLRDYLRQRLAQDVRIDVRSLHRRAARWFAARESWTDAIRHAIEARELDLAVQWMEPFAMTLVKQGELLTLLQWTRQLPARLLDRQPRVKLAIVWGLTLAMRFQEARAQLDEMEREFAHAVDRDARPGDFGQVSDLRYEFEVIRAAILSLGDDVTAAGRAIETALTLKRSAEPWPTNALYNAIRWRHFIEGRLTAYYATPWLPAGPEADSRQVLVTVYRLCLQGMIEMQQGHAAQARHHYEEAIAFAQRHAGQDSVMALLPLPLFAQVLYEENRLEDVEAMITGRLEVIQAVGFLDVVLCSFRLLARTAHARHDRQQALALLDQAVDHGYLHGWGRLIAGALFERFQLLLEQGRLEAAQACADRLALLCDDYPGEPRSAWSSIHDWSMHADALLALAGGRLAEAQGKLEALQAIALRQHLGHYRITLYLHLANVHLLAGRRAHAVGSLDAAVSSARHPGMLRCFVDHLIPLGRSTPRLSTLADGLMATMAAALSGHPRQAQILDALAASPSNDPPQAGAFGTDPLAGSAATSPAPAGFPGPLSGAPLAGAERLVAPPPAPGRPLLTAREQEILALIAAGLSNKDIGRELTIAPETVKYHLKRIFSRLNVQSRAHAVSRAQALGLICAAP